MAPQDGLARNLSDYMPDPNDEKEGFEAVGEESDGPSGEDSGVITFKADYSHPTLLESLGRTLLWLVVIVLTLGLGSFWVWADRLRMQAKHTTINGRALKFTGTGFDIFLFYGKFILLTMITFGIYGFFFPSNYQRFLNKHRFFADGD